MFPKKTPKSKKGYPKKDKDGKSFSEKKETFYTYAKEPFGKKKESDGARKGFWEKDADTKKFKDKKPDGEYPKKSFGKSESSSEYSPKKPQSRDWGNKDFGKKRPSFQDKKKYVSDEELQISSEQFPKKVFTKPKFGEDGFSKKVVIKPKPPKNDFLNWDEEPTLEEPKEEVIIKDLHRREKPRYPKPKFTPKTKKSWNVGDDKKEASPDSRPQHAGAPKKVWKKESEKPRAPYKGGEKQERK